MTTETQLELQFLPEDGPETCLWKAMHGQDWLSSPQIMARLEEAGCRFARVTMRNKLGSFSRDIMETRPMPNTPSIYRSAKQYRLIAGKPMPDNLDPKGRGPRNTSEDDKRIERQKESMTAAVDQMSAMMMMFAKR
jgi:hypothetical protein